MEKNYDIKYNPESKILSVKLYEDANFRDAMESISAGFLEESLKIGGRIFVDLTELKIKLVRKQIERASQFVINFAKYFDFRIAILINPKDEDAVLISSEETINPEGIEFKFFENERKAILWLKEPENVAN